MKQTALTCWCFCAIFVGHLVAADDDDSDEAGVGRQRREADVIAKKLRIVTVQSMPYTNITQTESGPRFVGFIPDLISMLSKRLHFDYEFYESPDGRFGNSLPNGTWTGMVGELILNRHDPDGNVSSNNDPERPGADIAAAPLTITRKRQSVVNFLHPFHSLGLTVLVQKTDVMDNGSDIWPFYFSILKPLSPAVWGMIFLTGAVVGALLCALNYFNPYEWGGRYNLGLADVHHKDSFSLSGSFWFVFTTLQWQGFERAPRAISSKILTCFWFAFVTLTLVTYISGFVNQLWWSTIAFRHSPSGHPITGLDDLVAGAGMDFKYGVIRGGATYSYVTEVAARQKDEFRIMKKYWETPDGEEQLVDGLDDGLEKIRMGKYALIVETMVARWLTNQRPCDLTTVGAQFGVRSYGLAVPHNWPFYDKFHLAIMQLKEEGAIDELEEKWWEGRGECWDERQAEKALRKANAIYLSQAKPKVVDLQMFWGQLVLIVLGIVLTLISAVAEILYYRYKGKYVSSNRMSRQSLKLENEDGNI